MYEIFYKSTEKRLLLLFQYLYFYDLHMNMSIPKILTLRIIKKKIVLLTTYNIVYIICIICISWFPSSIINQ